MEVHNKIPGNMVGTMFVDAAMGIDSKFVGSCGAGILIGPIKLELARHKAKNSVLLGLR
jgi:hypothetical protein